MPDDEILKDVSTPPESISPKKRQNRVETLSARLNRMERVLDAMIEDYYGSYASYIAIYRIRYGCDPDTNEVPVDYLDGPPAEEGEPE